MGEQEPESTSEPEEKEKTIDDTLQRIFEQDEKIVMSNEEKLKILKNPSYIKIVLAEIEKRKAEKKQKKDNSS